MSHPEVTGTPQSSEHKDRSPSAVDAGQRYLYDYIIEAFVDPRPNVPARKVFRRLHEHHAVHLKGSAEHRGSQ